VLVVTVGLAALAAGMPRYFGSSPVWAIPSAIAFLAAGWLGSGVGHANLPPLRRVALATVASLVGFGLLAAKVLPNTNPMWPKGGLFPSREIARVFEANRPCPDSTLVSAGFEEPSLVFLTNTS